MGFFDALFGRTRVPVGKTDQLFAIATAALDIETKLSSPFSGHAGLILRTVDNADYERIERDMHDILALSGRDMPVTTRSHGDALGFVWILVDGQQIDDVINALHLSADMVKEAGYGDSLLAALFGFEGWYLVYSYRRATFYPFAPQPSHQRNSSREFRIAATLRPSLPIEKDPERWYPLWDPPF
ncbi:MAG: hypothetical protein M0Z53_09485 [Thermaerobacter sp.]|nr:hypothetical protein [Thermaerobacter sp.]